MVHVLFLRHDAEGKGECSVVICVNKQKNNVHDHLTLTSVCNVQEDEQYLTLHQVEVLGQNLGTGHNKYENVVTGRDLDFILLGTQSFNY